MKRSFHVALGLLVILCVATVGVTIVQTDAVSDFLFALPTWAIVLLIVGYPFLALLCVLVFGRAPAQADREISAALARREHPAVNLDVEIDEWVDWPANVVPIPARKPAEVVPIRGGGGWRV